MAKMTENDKIAKYGVVVQLVMSHSKPDEGAHAIRMKDGVYACDCKGWVFSKSVPKTCKHIDFYLKQAKVSQKVVELTEIQITEKCLKTAGCYDAVKNDCPTLEAFQHKLARLAQALLPYFGGNGPALAMDTTNDIRTIWLDD